jgi:hypothetical protein
MKTLPTHIKDCVKDIEYTEDFIKGTICCTCGNRVFTLYYPGETTEYNGKVIPCSAYINDHSYFILRAQCSECKKEFLLFDRDFHGWDGYVCHDEKDASKPRPPLVPWKCIECNEDKHVAQIMFCYGDEDEMLEDLGGTKINLADAFEWIYVNIKCKICGHVTEKWVDYETA